MNIETLIYVGSTNALALFGYFIGVVNEREAQAKRKHDRDCDLDFIEAMGYSLQCVDDRWAVTDNGRVIGHSDDTLRGAIASAARSYFDAHEASNG